ncbi:iron-sulfur cluster biosynthesis family protein [Atopococcus tabaci]|uniref:iron-sulfur cluster biosynthesis family protein n=1 Tax=Atopococcus tabaci TaxID=269774 RepID=UPI00042649E6|nr:iron-sulfur cluster biosynthesis family protein [Atopococcus tabaci]
MYLNVTDSAKKRLEKITDSHDGKVALYYNEGFKGTYACSIRGVFTLKLISNDSTEYAQVIDSNVGPFYIDRTDYGELTEKMTLDYNKPRNVLSLRSPYGIIADNMDVLDEDDKKVY